MALRVEPVTAERWRDLVELFGPNGAYSNCWCTWWILTGRDWEAATGSQRKKVIEDLVAAGAEPGLLAYEGEEAVGWCAVGPRSRYQRMMSPRATVYHPLDDDPDGWVINCFYIKAGHRGEGIARVLLEAAIPFAFSRGADRIEAYPLDVEARAKTTRADLFVGALSMFLDAGFEEVTRIKDRPVVRRVDL
jgi:GNAT superfamily N-acetyltransferase